MSERDVEEYRDYYNPNKPKRVEKWQFEEDEVKRILRINELPRQSMDSNEWQRFTEHISTGDEVKRDRAKKELFMRRIRTTYGTANTFANTLNSDEITVEELFQEACIGLFEAIKDFDSKSHDSLLEHIQYSVFSKLTQAARKRSLILNGHQIEQLDKLNKAKDKIINKLGSAATEEALRSALEEETGLSADKIQQLEDMQNNIGYENLLDYEDIHVNTANRDELPLEEIVGSSMDAECLRDALGLLEYEERRVLELLYGLNGEVPHTFKDIGKRLGRQVETIQRRLNQAFKALEGLPETQKLRDAAGSSFGQPHDPLAWRWEEEWAHSVQSKRDKQEIERILLSKYHGDRQSDSKEDMLREGLAKIILESLFKLEEQKPQKSYSISLLKSQLNLPSWCIRLIKVDFEQSLNWLVEQGFVFYTEPISDYWREVHVRLTSS